MTYDYKAFNDGRLAEVLSGNRERMVWAKKAGNLRSELSAAEIDIEARDISSKVWLEIAKMLREEIEALDPQSPLANKDYLNNLYFERRAALAAERGYQFDEEGYMSYKP